MTTFASHETIKALWKLTETQKEIAESFKRYEAGNGLSSFTCGRAIKREAELLEKLEELGVKGLGRVQYWHQEKS